MYSSQLEHNYDNVGIWHHATGTLTSVTKAGQQLVLLGLAYIYLNKVCAWMQDTLYIWSSTDGNKRLMERGVEWNTNAGTIYSGDTHKLWPLWTGLIRGKHQNQKLDWHTAERHSSSGGGEVFNLEGNCIPPITANCLILELALSLQWKIQSRVSIHIYKCKETLTFMHTIIHTTSKLSKKLRLSLKC